MKVSAFIDGLLDRGFSFFSGVPCSFLKPVINYVIDHSKCSYIPATVEGEAIAMAAGAYMANKFPVVLLQNSGLGNIVNPLSSLLHPYKIPVLLLITWRGEPGLKDAAQHSLMGEITLDLLHTLRCPYEILEPNQSSLTKCLSAAKEAVQHKGTNFALIIRKGTFQPYTLTRKKDNFRDRNLISETFGQALSQSQLPSRIQVMQSLLNSFSGQAIISSTGYISRGLFNAGDLSSFFYMQGSMGYALSIGMGVSLNHPKQVIVIDGDGALLMRMSVAFTAGMFHRNNLIYILLDNRAHESTGGQATISANIDFESFARASGFETFFRVNGTEKLKHAVTRALAERRLCFLHVGMKLGGTEEMARPNLSPPEIAKRFMKYLKLERES